MKKSGLLVNIKPGTIFKCVHHDATHRLFISVDVSIWISMPSQHVKIYDSNFALTENWQKI